MNIAWCGVADNHYWNRIARYCVPSWRDLPGTVFCINEQKAQATNGMISISYQRAIDTECKFRSIADGAKIVNFWKKMRSQIWALDNLAWADVIVMLDTDIEAVNFDQDRFYHAAQEFLESRQLWATSHRAGCEITNNRPYIDSGVVFFNPQHPDAREWRKNYEAIWNSGAIWHLPAPYDGDAVVCMLRLYPSFRINHLNINKGCNLYAWGMTHWGSVSKQWRKTAKPREVHDLVDQPLQQFAAREFPAEIIRISHPRNIATLEEDPQA